MYCAAIVAMDGGDIEPSEVTSLVVERRAPSVQTPVCVGGSLRPSCHQCMESKVNAMPSNIAQHSGCGPWCPAAGAGLTMIVNGTAVHVWASVPTRDLDKAFNTMSSRHQIRAWLQARAPWQDPLLCEVMCEDTEAHRPTISQPGIPPHDNAMYVSTDKACVSMSDLHRYPS